MTILIFLIVLAVLILVHEFGHFIIAKKSGIRVDEFGLGFPPRAWGYTPKGSETMYSLNWIPFGGFVKIFGETPDENSITGPDSSRSFVNKPKYIQAAVLVGGVLFNIIFAWLLYSIAFMGGMPIAVDEEPGMTYSEASQILVVDIGPDTPAFESGLMLGDEIVSISNTEETLTRDMLSVQSIQTVVAQSDDAGITLDVVREGEEVMLTLVPEEGIVEGQKAMGIALTRVDIVEHGLFSALWEGLVTTVTMIRDITVGLVTFLYQAITGQADFENVAGPVGIAGLVGDAARLGIVQLLMFTAFISLNLAVLNMLPFPALDGGRLLFVLIEAIKGSPIKPSVANTINGIGFALLLLLMLVVTYKDIVKLF